MSRRRPAKIEIKVVNREDAAPPTKGNSPVVKALSNAIRDAMGINPELTGIGGGTCAGIFRKNGHQAAVWSTCDGVAHIPNEYIHIKNLVNDAKVYANLYIQ